MKEVTLNLENFETEVINSEIPVLVDFWATWCGPCMMLSPIVSEIAEAYEGKVKVGKVNVDEHSTLAAGYGITSIPTLLLFKDGKVVKTAVGYQSREKIEAMLG
ncbi:MAG: thioredoxin [Ruminococcus sp.]|nr:thioredoxin [Ruminococcus sp.]